MSATAAATWKKPALVAIATTAVVTALSYLLPEEHAATGVGLAFLAATYLVALRQGARETPAHWGLALGGLLESDPLSARRLLRDGVGALGWALLLSAIFFPPFVAGWLAWWHPPQSFSPAPLTRISDQALGQLLVIALPEEAFYRGYLQTAFDDAWPKRVRILGAEVGLGLVVSSALFALGHVATELHPNRLAVFFPALLFGWLRARTGGVGAGIAFHAFCNLFASYLAASYGIGR